MKFPTGHGLNILYCGLVVFLAACTSGDPSAPTFNSSLSVPQNQEVSVNAGASSTGNFVHFDLATTEDIALNPDSLGGVSLQGNGGGGALTITPPATQIPGIYYLTIYAQNTNGTVSTVFVVNVLPPFNVASTPGGTLDTAYTVLDFAMNGQAGLRNPAFPLFTARNEMIATTTFSITDLQGNDPSAEGVTVNSVYSVPNETGNSYQVYADIQVAPNATTPYTALTITNADGSTTSYPQCVPLLFQATPSSNGYTMTNYTENICLNLTDTAS